MGVAVTIVLVAAVVEAVLAAASILRGSSLVRVRHIVSIAFFVAFLAITALGVLAWGARYLLLAVVLVVRAGMGVAHLAGTRHGARPIRNGQSIRRAIVTTLLLGGATFPAVLFPQYLPIETTGEHPVRSVSYSWEDEARTETYVNTGQHRKINVQFWYPDDADEIHPLIVFSHGAFGVRTSNASLFNELASHGYVVASIDHTYHSLYTTDEDGRTTWIDVTFMRELVAENARVDREQSYGYYRKWMAVRTGDIDFVIDRISAIATSGDAHAPFERVDTERIGVMGHSLGGSAALGIGRTRGDVGAVVALESPYLLDIEGVRDGAFVFTSDAYPVPVLNVYSDTGWDILADRPQYAANHALRSTTSPHVFDVHIEGAGHLDLTDLSLTSPLLTRMLNQRTSAIDRVSSLRRINDLCLAFFDRYLMRDGCSDGAPCKGHPGDCGRDC